MKMERLDYRELKLGSHMEAVVGGRIFIPSHKPIEELPPPPPPVFNEEEMKTSEREGYKKGFVEGVKEGRQQSESEQTDINRQIAAFEEHFMRSVSPMFEHYRDMVSKLQKDLPNVALAIARKIAGVALDENASAVVSELAMKACENLISEPELTIIAHESMADTLEKHLQQLAERLPEATKIIIVRDPHMQLADCRIEWRNGSMERVTEKLWQQVEKAVANMATIAERDTNAELQQVEQQIATANDTPTETNQPPQ